ncbi:NmrA/HSCARG family protein [Paramicrobacterium sp. CJ85]|uniref:NmrA/HSCARG family protein n=1 Tax=Paramicrobacterium sp. CJ85 TaxID=3445355 RepID=UPI003F64593D
MTSTILVTGATGNQGGAVARALSAHGHSVRAMTRSTESPKAHALRELGMQVVGADFDDGESLRRAASGVDGVYAMGTPYEADAAAEERQTIALLDAAVAVGVPFIVYASVASALDDTRVPHFESKAQVERHLQTLTVPHTVVAPAMFMDNAARNLEALREGTYAFGVPADTAVQQVALADLAEFTALVFDDPQRFDGQRIELASAEVTGAETAEALSEVLGHRVEYREIPLDAIEASSNHDLAAMMRFFRERGYSIDIDALHAAYPEVAWHSIESWAREQRW